MALTEGRSRRTPIVAVASVTLFALVVPAVSAGASVAPAQIRSCVVPAVATHAAPISGTSFGAPRAWPSKVLVKKAMVQVLDAATGSMYELLSENPDSAGPDLLEGFSLKGGPPRKGPTFGLGGGYSNSLALADGALWVGGSVGAGNDPPGPQLCQVNPTTLRVVRRVPLPPPGPGNSSGAPTLVSPGPRGTVWVGYQRTLADVDVRNGAVLSTQTVPSGVIVSLATDPAIRLLYVSVSYPTIDGKAVDAAVEERSASTGQLLVSTSATSPVTGSVAGGILTALPDGVATSFRTGMHGGTVLLSAADLSEIIPPGLGTADRFPDKPPADIFSWPMDASTLYASGSLWIENEWGVLACVDPASGAVRASEQSDSANGSSMELLGTVAHRHQLLGAVNNEVLSITAPKTCWR